MDCVPVLLCLLILHMHTKNVRDKTDYSLKMTFLHLVKATSCSKHREKPLK